MTEYVPHKGKFWFLWDEHWGKCRINKIYVLGDGVLKAVGVWVYDTKPSADNVCFFHNVIYFHGNYSFCEVDKGVSDAISEER